MESLAFTAKLWLWPSEKASWYFITLPLEVAEALRFYHGAQKRGFGSIPILVTIGDSQWKTSVFPSKKSGSFILPIKSAIRKAEKLGLGDEIHAQISVRES